MNTSRRAALLSTVAVFGLAAGPAWAVYRCRVQGELVYQQVPCAHGTSDGAVDLSGAKPPKPASLLDGLPPYVVKDSEEGLALVASLTDEAKKKRAEIARIGISKRMAFVGMLPSEVGLAMGRPDSVNVTQSLGGVSEQWVYRYLGVYVYVRGGVVTSVQSER